MSVPNLESLKLAISVVNSWVIEFRLGKATMIDKLVKDVDAAIFSAEARGAKKIVDEIVKTEDEWPYHGVVARAKLDEIESSATHLP